MRTGGEKMKKYPISGQDLLNVFDYFCKKVMRYKNYKLLKSEKRKKERGVIYVGMDQHLLDIEHTEDEYSILYFG